MVIIKTLRKRNNKKNLGDYSYRMESKGYKMDYLLLIISASKR